MDAAALAFHAEHPELTREKAFVKMLESDLGRAFYTGSYNAESGDDPALG